MDDALVNREQLPFMFDMTTLNLIFLQCPRHLWFQAIIDSTSECIPPGDHKNKTPFTERRDQGTIST